MCDHDDEEVDGDVIYYYSMKDASVDPSPVDEEIHVTEDIGRAIPPPRATQRTEENSVAECLTLYANRHAVLMWMRISPRKMVMDLDEEDFIDSLTSPRSLSDREHTDDVDDAEELVFFMEESW